MYYSVNILYQDFDFIVKYTSLCIPVPVTWIFNEHFVETIVHKFTFLNRSELVK